MNPVKGMITGVSGRAWDRKTRQLIESLAHRGRYGDRPGPGPYGEALVLEADCAIHPNTGKIEKKVPGVGDWQERSTADREGARDGPGGVCRRWLPTPW